MKLTNVKDCKSIKSRFLGMMFQFKKQETGYLFRKCNSIHTFFCFFHIDAVLLDKNSKVICIKKDLKPWRIYFFKCTSILEYASGYLPIDIKENIEVELL
jgi:uncharacterized membrane protein (UPF0127 family)